MFLSQRKRSGASFIHTVKECRDQCALFSRAIILLARDGWCQGYLRDEKGRRCAMGALLDADYERYRYPGTHGCNRELFPESIDDFLEMVKAPGAIVSPTFAEWNDNPRRRKGQVIKAFRRFIRMKS